MIKTAIGGFFTDIYSSSRSIGPHEILQFRGARLGRNNTPLVIPAQAGIQLAHRANLCHFAQLRKFAFANWIPPCGGMTMCVL